MSETKKLDRSRQPANTLEEDESKKAYDSIDYNSFLEQHPHRQFEKAVLNADSNMVDQSAIIISANNQSLEESKEDCINNELIYYSTNQKPHPFIQPHTNMMMGTTTRDK